MIVYDKEQKEIVIPNGIGNINLFNNGVEAGYNQGYEQGQADVAAKAREVEVTKNGFYLSKFSDPIFPELVTGRYADGTEFYNYAELNGKIFNTKITATEDSRLEVWYKGDNKLSGDGNNVIIGAGNRDDDNSFKVIYFVEHNNILHINLGNDDIVLREWDDTVWHHLIVSKAEGLWIDGVKKKEYSEVIYAQPEGEFYINGISYDVNSDGIAIRRNANGYFGMIKIDDVVIIPTANGFLNTNTGELLEVVKDGGYTFTENKIIYGKGELFKSIKVNVPDLNGSYDEGYTQGKIDGANEQKGKLESINITENGTYTKEDGYNHIEVNVADLNGSYDEGYEQGQTDAAANARVLNVTENGNYLSKFSDPVAPTLVTGRYADGTDFYNYATLSNQVYNTNITVTQDSVVELWYKGDNESTDDGWNTIFGCAKRDDDDFYLGYMYTDTTNLRGFIGQNQIQFSWDDNVWHHIIMKNDGLWVDDVLMGSFNTTKTFAYSLGLNGTWDGLIRNANGCYGMIKIDDVVIIPTAEGFKNVNTGELIEVVKDGGYTFTENKIRYGEGELYKTINVNVLPKINIQKAGLNFAYSKFTEVPEWADFEGITDMGIMFYQCSNLQIIPFIDTSNVTSMRSTFAYCPDLKNLPNNLNLGNCTDMQSLFEGVLLTDYTFLTPWIINPNAEMGSMITNENVDYVPAIPCVGNNGYYQSAVFWSYGVFSKLIYFGGWIGRKYNVTQDYILKKMTALSYESCISILNNLYDFTGNGETPNSEQGQLKVAQSFIDKVGDEISIGLNKGWSISV